VALGASVAGKRQPVVTAVSGHISRKSSQPVSPQDAWHIGSNTKALTALLYARLVEDEAVDWGTSAGTLFSGAVETIDPAWQSVSVEDLFAHRSGAGDIGAIWLISRHADDAPAADQRLETVRARLSAPPPGTPGEFSYSNLNYIIAGAAIEIITGMSWEDAMREYVLEVPDSNWSPGWGVGPPQSGLLGHKRNLFGVLGPSGRGAGADNPVALGPAGTLHAPLESHARLLLEFLDEESRLVSPAMREKLLEPWPDENAGYAMGWGVSSRKGLGTIYAHRGSNTMWLSHAELIPSRDAVFVVNTNAFTNGSREAVSELVRRIEIQFQSDRE
jgi:CubicO group peptidase (beta-lactamase class C family)